MMTFTDEQLLNLVNNTIKTKTEFEINDFTGGSIQLTSTNNHQLIKYKVSLFFGYSNRNAISKTFSIKEDFVTIWQKAILLKVKSLQTTNNGMDYSEINALMNNLEQVEVVSNKVVSISKGSTNNRKINRTIDFNQEILTISTNELNEKHFSLSKPSLFRDAPSEYLETLERYINNYVDKLEIEININGGNLSKVLKWDDFYLGAYNYEKKYVNFAMTYHAWARRSK